MSLNITNLIKPSTFKALMSIGSNVEDKLILPDLDAAQDIYIKPICGTALYEKILTDVAADSLAGSYKILVDTYLIKALCNYTMAELPSSINYQFTNKGVIERRGEDSTRQSMREMYDTVDKYRNRAEYYKDAAVKYLQQNHSLFPEYDAYGTGVDAVPPDSNAFTCPFYLSENEERSGKSFEERYQGNRPNC